MSMQGTCQICCSMKKRVSVIGSKSKLRQEKRQRTKVSRVSKGKGKRKQKISEIEIVDLMKITYL